MVDPSLWQNRLRDSLRHAKARAARKGLPFTVDIDWVVGQLKAQDYRCKVTGIPFHASHPFEMRKENPWTPSLDRIDSNLGYTPENVRLVCKIFNLAKNAYSDEDVIIMSKRLIAQLH